jgi:hypothetical protein
MVDYHLPGKLCKSENFMYFFPIRTFFAVYQPQIEGSLVKGMSRNNCPYREDYHPIK